SMQIEFEVPFPVALAGITERLPHSFVPEHHRAATILSLGNCALELAILKGMVFDLHRKALVGRVKVWALRNSPALEHPIELKAKVVMQMRCIVLLNHEREPSWGGLWLFSLWFGRSTKVPLFSILNETHEIDLGRSSASPYCVPPRTTLIEYD